MKRIAITYFLLFGAHWSFGQKNIEGLIQAEKNFAAFSVANGAKEAFLKFLDSSGIIFEKGMAVNGIQSWTAREKPKGVLDWQPRFAEISLSNDFGYTTGPWTFRQSAHDTIVARGQYTTIWHIDKNGDWKFLIDLGVNNTPAIDVEEIKKINTPRQSGKTDFIPHVSPLVLAENSFIKLFAKNKSKAYKKYLSKESILNHKGYALAFAPEDQQVVLASTSSSIQYTMDGWGQSPEQDMGYTYGRAVLNGKTENYQRIWRLEKDGWKIAVEVLRL